MSFDNTNRGALFKNNRKESDTHPDYTGSLNVDGSEYFLNAWIKEGKNGKFFSINIKPKTGSSQSVPPRRAVEADDSEIPF